MFYNEHKTREMMRSILPSKSRDAARCFKKSAKRAARSNIKQCLREYRNHRTMLEDEDGFFDDADLILKIHEQDCIQANNIRNVVSRRRDADKINHFVRWAEHLTEGIEDKREKRKQFISIIGGSGDLIRDHAIGHFISPWELNPMHGWRWRNRKPEPDIGITREMFEEALTEASKVFTWEALDHIISPENDSGMRFFGHRRQRCKLGKHACMMRTLTTTAVVTHIIQPDGSRKRAWGWHDLTNTPREKWHRIIPKGAVYYIRNSYRDWHDHDNCKHIVRLLKQSDIRGVRNYIFGRKKQMLVRSSKAKYWRHRQKRRLLQSFYDFFVEEGFIQED